MCRKPKDDASTLNGLDDFGRSVATQNKSSGLAEIANNHPERVLGAFGQTVSFVKEDYLGSARGKRDFLLSE